ncbi:NUDIX domain-containing protein, partial [Candidatus Gottesmanbacteria bacterium]|nr:NUDIX domain-containing protein [Candidatus Gottesmanbacteria bacterium]
KFKGCLDFSVGGYVKTGESYDEAFTRERSEEIKNNSDTVRFYELGYLNPNEHPVSSFMKVYKLTVNQEPRYDASDFSEAMWISPQGLVDKVISGDTAKSDLIPVVKLFFLPPT